MMASEKLENETDKVLAHIEKLDMDIRETVQTIRQLILSISPQIGERIKWNNPSFFYNGPMKPFAPKEYKREIAVFNLFKNNIMLVFTSGAKVDDGSGFLEGKYQDGRRLLIFKDLQDVKSKEVALKNIIQQWLQMIEL
ncbi:MAG: DUF1801 domain-containing protein [Bacteroidetes bacterium]|nr:DUF1801 domain-containing protein [Bacteroidota bacterium]